MDKEDIINYVMETPGNSNPAVLGSMLESYGGGSSTDFLIVNLTMNEDDDTFIGDKTASELNSVIINAKPIIFIYESDFWKAIWWGTNF